MSLFPRFVSHDFPRFVANDFAPVWRLLDDYANQVVSTRNDVAPGSEALRRFNPRFDVREVDNTYELHGELPGIDQKHVDIEFLDHQTIVIKGDTEYTREGERPAQKDVSQQAIAEQPSRQPTIEDETEVSGANPEAAPREVSKATSTEGSTETKDAVQTVNEDESSREIEQPNSRYWLTERFTGQFQRTFNFPVPVDTDNATAKLKDGVLRVVIPKARKAGIKRIAVL